MKSRVVVLLIGSFCLMLTLIALPFLSACGGPTAKVDLTYNLLFPAVNYHYALAQEWANEINQRTDGAVTITLYPVGGLAPPADTYDACVEDIADIGMSCLSYTMGRFPVFELVDVPHGYPDGWVATHVAWDYYNEFKPAELADTHLLYLHAHGPGVVYTTKTAVRTLEDIKGLVLRSTGVGANIAEALGATGYAASQKEALELMQKGVIDGSVTPLEPLKGWNQAPVVKYVTNCYEVGYTTVFYVTMNKAKWDSLPGSVQKVFTEVSEEYIEKHAKLWVYYDKVGKDYFLSLGEGREVIELSPQEMARWVEATRSVKDVYMTEKGAMGLSVAQFEDYLNNRVAYWSARAPSEAECKAWAESEVVPLVPAQ